MIEDIEIFVVYYSNAGRETTFFDIVEGKEVMDLEHYNPSGFWGCGGGLKIITDNFNTLFNSVKFEYLVKATSFLIRSMYWIKGTRFSWNDVEEEYENGVTLKTETNDLIFLRKSGINKLLLSYFSSNKGAVRERGQSFFEDIIISEKAWYNASQQALTEYFVILKKITDENPLDESNVVMLNYYNAWLNLL